MNKKLINIYILFLFIPFLFCACNTAPPYDEQPNNDNQNEYTAITLMSDTIDIVDFYSNDIIITKNENNLEIKPDDCFYNTITEDFLNLVVQCYDFWTHCEKGGISYSEISGSVTKNYDFTFDGTNLNTIYIYTDSSRNPTGSGYRITKSYDISFKTNHLSICYENKDESFYNETKYYVDILTVENGIFAQYYKKQYNGDYFKTYSYDIYKFRYDSKSDKLLYTANKLKDGSSISTISNIELSTFENFEMPNFIYTIKKI